MPLSVSVCNSLRLYPLHRFVHCSRCLFVYVEVSTAPRRAGEIAEIVQQALSVDRGQSVEKKRAEGHRAVAQGEGE